MSWQARRPTLQEVALVTMATRRRCPGSARPCGGRRRQTVASSNAIWAHRQLDDQAASRDSRRRARGSRQPLFREHGVRQNRVSAVGVVMIGRVVVFLVLVLCNVSAAELLPASQRWLDGTVSASVSELSHCSMLDAHLSVAGSESERELQPRRRLPWTILAPVSNGRHCRPRRLTFPDSAAAAVNSLGRQESCNPWKSSPHSAPFGPIWSPFCRSTPNRPESFSSGSMRKETS